jgi:AmmeMemoRadiSam system protein B
LHVWIKMKETTSNHYPRLRALDTQAVLHRGKVFLLLRDPLNLSDTMVLVPEGLAPVLSLCDGTFDDRQMQEILVEQHGVRIDDAEIEDLLRTLDESFLLENQRSRDAKEIALQEYRRAPFRPPILAGKSYPAQVDDLRTMLDGFTSEVGAPQSTTLEVRGLVSPHIDYMRGGRVYAEVWNAAAEAAREAELVVILGTDHFGPDRIINLTHQDYSTPFGVLPTNKEIVNQLAETGDEDAAFEGELYHSSEHSIELAAVWLHSIRDGEPCELVPILCGSFAPFIRGDFTLNEDESLRQAVSVLKDVSSRRRTLFVAAADLAHVGPVFGGEPLDLPGHARLHRSDQELLERICDGDATGFFSAIQNEVDRDNICGTAPIYLTMTTLSPIKGQVVGYEHCPADEQDQSAVSVCGVLFGN